MIVTCPECLTKFRLEEDRIPEGGAKTRCSRCRHVFPIQKPAPPEESFFSRAESPAEFGEMDQYQDSSRHFLLRWKRAILVTLLVVVAAGLILYFGKDSLVEKSSQYYSALGRYFDERVTALKKVSLPLPYLKKYVGMGDQTEGFISLEKVRGYYLESSNLNKVFVIEGEAVNHWKESRSFIKVKGVLLDSKGKRVQEQEAYCGNILSEKDLKEMSQGAIEKSASSQFGISFSNVNLLPNKGIPFMVVFMNLPPEKPQSKAPHDPAEKPGEVSSILSDFTVEITSSQKGSK